MFAFLNRPLSQQSSPSVRGGWRMRATRVTQAAERSRSRSPKRGHKRCKAAERHLKDWAEGISSAPRICGHMKASCEDGPVLPMVHRLSRIGGSGSVINDRTCHSNLMSMVGECGVAELVCEVPTPDSVVYYIRPTALIKMISIRSP